MNFKVSKRIFYNALQTVSRSISSNSPLPALTGININVTNNEIILIGSDSDISIQTKLSNELFEDLNLVVNETGSIVIEAKYIIEIVRKIDADVIEIEIIDGSLTKISGESAEFNINGMRSSDYPLIDFNEPVNSFEINSSTILKIINQTTFATSDKETRPVLTGVNFDCKSNILKCVATDSYRLAQKTVILDNVNDFNITIPAKSLNEVSKTIEDECTVRICVSDKKVQFIIGSTIIQSRLIDGTYPETERLIPTVFPHELEIDSRDLLNAIDRASFIKNEGINIIKLNANSDEVIISSRSQEVGSSQERINVLSYTGNPIELSFSGRYVFEALRALQSNVIKISFSGEMKPFIITTRDDDKIIQLILPVRTYN